MLCHKCADEVRVGRLDDVQLYREYLLDHGYHLLFSEGQKKVGARHCHAPASVVQPRPSPSPADMRMQADKNYLYG